MKNKTIYLIIATIFIVLIIILLMFGCENRKTISLDFGDGTVKKIKVKANEEIDLEKPMKDGYTFLYYVDEYGVVCTDKLKVINSKKLYAKWIKSDKKTSNVSFNVDGKIETIKIENNTKIEFIKEPVKDGFIFAGWKLNDKIVLKNTNVLEDMELEANWIPKNRGISRIEVDGEYYYVETDKQIILPTNPIKDGYAFKGWYLEDGTQITDKTIVTDDIKLIPKFVSKYTCPSNCLQNEDLKTCTKTTEISLSKTYSCSDGYSLRNDKCINFSKKYPAESINESPFWKCNGNDYGFDYEEAGGADRMCAPVTNPKIVTGCKSGYEKKDNKCVKIETIKCTENK